MLLKLRTPLLGSREWCQPLNLAVSLGNLRCMSSVESLHQTVPLGNLAIPLGELLCVIRIELCIDCFHLSQSICKPPNLVISLYNLPPCLGKCSLQRLHADFL